MNNKKNRFKFSETCILYDRKLLWLTLVLVSIGFVMVASSSIPIGIHLLGDSFYFIKKNIFYLIISFFISLIVLKIPIILWKNNSRLILILTLCTLLLTLIIGNPINGASRWITLGVLSIQPSELSKLSLFFYLSDYLVRKIKKLRNCSWEFYKLIVIILIISVLLLAQPDLGSVIVISTTALLMIFLAGVRIKRLLLTFSLIIFIMILLIIIEPYRVNRIISFWNPWIDPFGSGYQITQSLIALGRGKLIGQGLGNSIQKLNYLPEAHTDFIFAILGEELGYVGVFFTLIIIFMISLRSISIGRKAFKINYFFSGFLSCSIGIWFSLQTILNVGAVIGSLPIEGLTLPLISYGGSSMIIMLIAIMIILRIDFEVRLVKGQAFAK